LSEPCDPEAGFFKQQILQVSEQQSTSLKKKKKEQQSTYRAKESILGYTAVKMLIARPH